jgi:glycine oxidase
MPERADVLVIGGGVIGLTTAYYLASRHSVRVTVLDRGPLGREASWAGAGIVPPGRPEKATSPFDKLRAVSSQLLPRLSAELREATGIDNGYRVSGGIEIAADEPMDPAAWTDEGIEWRAVDADEVRRVEPAIEPAAGPAYFLPGMAQIRNPRHLQALIAAAAKRGVTLRPGCPVLGFERNGHRITAAVTADGPETAGQYLVCSGAWTDGLLGPLGGRIGCRPVRGQIALLRGTAPSLRRIVLVGKRYLVPRDDGRVLVGSTEEDAGFDTTTTAEAIAGLLRFATELVPALGSAGVEKCWAGLRPGSADGWPTLGRLPGWDNLWVAAGHFRAGLSLSAATGQVMAEALAGQPPSIPLEPFRPDREPGSPPPRAFRS